MIETTTEEIRPNKNNSTTRKEWVDFLRAMAILLVIFGHQWDGNTFFVFTSPIKIPMFFMITGYIFNYHRTSKAFFAYVLKRLLLPWITLTIPYILIYLPTRGIGVIKSLFIQPFLGEGAWYMPCCIIAEIIWYINCSLNKKDSGRIITAISIGIIGFLCARCQWLNFAMINRAMISQFYILLGFSFILFEKKEKDVSIRFIVIMSIIYIMMNILTLLVWPGQNIDVHNNRYYNILFCLVVISVGCCTCFCISKRINRFPKALLFIGQNSLVFYMLHPLNISVISRLLALLQIEIPSAVFIAILKTLLGSAMCYFEAQIINRFFPEFIGKYRRYNKRLT